jgi:hypothetical protein
MVLGMEDWTLRISPARNGRRALLRRHSGRILPLILSEYYEQIKNNPLPPI